MALDAQSNWNVEMPQLLLNNEDREDRGLAENTQAQSAAKPTAKPTTGREVDLPLEIIYQIISYIPRRKENQKTLWACCLVSRSWYSATIHTLYSRPYIQGRNFQEFVAVICPSKNAHVRRSQLAEMVKALDMGTLVHDGSKSLTARILGRLKGNLEEFVAPQASFSINCFAALSKCTHLRFLDLSLMSVSISTRVLFHTLRSLQELETLVFPRTSSRENDRDTFAYAWPPKLKALYIAGGIDDHFLRIQGPNLSPTVETLDIQHCPQMRASALNEFLAIIGPQLRQLTVLHPMNSLFPGALDLVLTWCPNLLALCVSADYISDQLFEDDTHIRQNHPLRSLNLNCSPTAEAEVGVLPDSIWLAIDSGCLPYLRSIKVNERLAWTATNRLRTSVSDLAELLEQKEKEIPTGMKPRIWSVVN